MIQVFHDFVVLISVRFSEYQRGTLCSTHDSMRRTFKHITWDKKISVADVHTAGLLIEPEPINCCEPSFKLTQVCENS